MACPRCGGNDLWDDNLWWGCNTCGYAGNEDGGTMCFAEDIEGLPRTVKEVNEKSGWTAFDYLPKLVANGRGEECDRLPSLEDHYDGLNEGGQPYPGVDEE